MIEHVLKKLEDERVLLIEATPDGIHFEEMCDNYFRSTLNKEETIAFAEHLLELAAELKE